MAPAVTIDNVSDFDPAPAKQSLTQRTLLLSPPSLSSHEEKLNNVIEAHDRHATDIQMLDRLSLGFVTLPDATYDLIFILTDADGSRTESASLLSRDVISRIVRSLKANGRLRSQDGKLGGSEAAEATEFILAGLVASDVDGFTKPDYGAQQSVPLRFGKKKTQVPTTSAVNGNGADTVALSPNGKRKSDGISSAGPPAGVGFVDFSDNFGELVVEYDEDGDELIDEDSLLTEEDKTQGIIQRKDSFTSIHTHEF